MEPLHSTGTLPGSIRRTWATPNGWYFATVATCATVTRGSPGLFGTALLETGRLGRGQTPRSRYRPFHSRRSQDGYDNGAASNSPSGL